MEPNPKPSLMHGSLNICLQCNTPYTTHISNTYSLRGFHSSGCEYSYYQEKQNEGLYPFQCRKCDKTVALSKYKSKNYTKPHKQRLCMKRCDGIKRNGAGIPLEPSLKRKYYEKRAEKAKIKKESLELTLH